MELTKPQRIEKQKRIDVIKQEIESFKTRFKKKGDTELHPNMTIDHIWVTFRDNSLTQTIIQKFEIVHPVIQKFREIFKMKNQKVIKFEN